MPPDLRHQRDPAATRRALLEAAFEEIYRSGFQAASLDAILRQAKVTKGALYHHFPNKAALGHAVIDELIRPYILAAWVEPLHESDDPIEALKRVCMEQCETEGPQAAELGCPLNNLMQEMSPIDEQFRIRLRGTMDAWRDGIAEALARGQRGGMVRSDIDPIKTAAFLVAATEGIAGTTKSAKSVQLMRDNIDVLSQFLDTLRPSPVSLTAS